MNVLSLFDGMSCGQIALERAGIKVDNYYASEINPIAIKVTQENYPDTIQLGDITKWYEWELPKIDLVIGGSPCQGFSVAGKGLNFEDPRSRLFFEFTNVLNAVKPNYFMLENVRMKQQWLDIITNSLYANPININSSLVSPQLRNRFYWTNIPNVEKPKDRGITLQSILDNGYTDRIKARCVGEQDSRPNVNPLKMFHRYYSTGFTTLIFKSDQHYLDCKEHYEKHFKDMSAKEIDETGITSDVYKGVRYLNQHESESLQTVPHGYTKSVTRNEAVGLLGNGWTVDVISHIFEGLKEKV